MNTFETNQAVVSSVRSIGLHLYNTHAKLHFAIQITEKLIAKFDKVHRMEEINNQLNEDLVTLYSLKKPPVGRGCLSQIIILGILGIIGAILQGC